VNKILSTTPPPFIEGEAIFMRALTRDDATEDYLRWLNDPKVLRYRGSKVYPSTMDGLLAYVDSIPARGDVVLAICERAGGRHVGNIALNSILWAHRRAELSIMLGARDVWGKGYAKEAIALLTCHGFDSMGLHRMWAESANPAFNAVVASLGWVREGSKREAFLLDGVFLDYACWSLLEAEFRC
jgi:ribosomal-protein-alanine N-acetyltransferase